MPLISLCMIVRNEEAVLGRCLDSVADLVDEIILVDTGSTDNTKAVAAEYAAKIYDFPWCDDFSAARNYAVSQAVGDYWLWLDADDVIEGENHEKLRKILEAPEADMVFLPYWLSFDAAGTPQMISRRERIFRRSRGYRFTGAVHEAVVPSGSIRYGDDTFVIGKLDAEIVADLHHPAAHALQLALHIDQVSLMKVEAIIVIRPGPVPALEIHLHHRRMGRIRVLPRLVHRFFTPRPLMIRSKTDLKCHCLSLLFSPWSVIFVSIVILQSHLSHKPDLI